MPDDPRISTWESMKRFPEVVELARTDPEFAALVSGLCAHFGALTVESVQNGLRRAVPRVEIDMTVRRGRGR